MGFVDCEADAVYEVMADQPTGIRRACHLKRLGASMLCAMAGTLAAGQLGLLTLRTSVGAAAVDPDAAAEMNVTELSSWTHPNNRQHAMTGLKNAVVVNDYQSMKSAGWRFDCAYQGWLYQPKSSLEAGVVCGYNRKFGGNSLTAYVPDIGPVPSWLGYQPQCKATFTNAGGGGNVEFRSCSSLTGGCTTLATAGAHQTKSVRFTYADHKRLQFHSNGVLKVGSNWLQCGKQGNHPHDFELIKGNECPAGTMSPDYKTCYDQAANFRWPGQRAGVVTAWNKFGNTESGTGWSFLPHGCVLCIGWSSGHPNEAQVIWNPDKNGKDDGLRAKVCLKTW